MKINDIFKITNGKSITNLPAGLFPIYGSTGIVGYTTKILYSGYKVLIARVGANCGYVQFAQGDYWVSDNTLVATNTDKILPKYGYYLLSTLNLKNYKIGAAQPLLTIGILNSIEINCHSLPEQNHIVNTISFLLLKSL